MGGFGECLDPRTVLRLEEEPSQGVLRHDAAGHVVGLRRHSLQAVGGRKPLIELPQDPFADRAVAQRADQRVVSGEHVDAKMSILRRLARHAIFRAAQAARPRATRQAGRPIRVIGLY